jgi:hypothetical protein
MPPWKILKLGKVTSLMQYRKLTYLKSADEAVSQNAVGLAAITRTLKNVIMNALNYQKIWNDTAKNLVNLTDYQSNISRTMRELEFMVIQLQQSVMSLQEGLETSATGRLSSVLIPPHPQLTKNVARSYFEVAPRHFVDSGIYY